MESVGDDSGVRFDPKETKSKAYCCVYGCTSKACRDFDVRLHLFPKIDTNFVKITNAFGQSEKVDFRKMWQIVLRIGKNISDHMQVCSLHFKKSDYFSPDAGSKSKQRLKQNAIPSCNLPCTDKTPQLIKKKNDDREKRRLRREKDAFLLANVSYHQEQDIFENLQTHNLIY